MSPGPTARLLDVTRFRPDLASHFLMDSGDTVTGPHIQHRAGTSARGGTDGHRLSGPEQGRRGPEPQLDQEDQIRWHLGNLLGTAFAGASTLQGGVKDHSPLLSAPDRLPGGWRRAGMPLASDRASWGREGQDLPQRARTRTEQKRRTLSWGEGSVLGRGFGSRGWSAGQRDRERPRGRDARGPRRGCWDRPRQPTQGLPQGPRAQ